MSKLIKRIIHALELTPQPKPEPAPVEYVQPAPRQIVVKRECGICGNRRRKS